MSLYYKGEKRYSRNQLMRKGLVNDSDISRAGFLKLELVKPYFDPYKEYLVDNGILNGNIDYTVTPLTNEILTIKAGELFEIIKTSLTASADRVTKTYYESSSLGTVHQYSDIHLSERTDVLSAIVAEVPYEVICTDSEGVELSRVHTTAQLVTLVSDRLIREQEVKLRLANYVIELTAARDAKLIDVMHSVRWLNEDPRDIYAVAGFN